MAGIGGSHFVPGRSIAPMGMSRERLKELVRRSEELLPVEKAEVLTGIESQESADAADVAHGADVEPMGVGMPLPFA